MRTRLTDSTHAAQIQNVQIRPYCYWFFKAYYQALGKQLSVISPKFVPGTEAGVDELLLFKADMYCPYRYA
jgi:hypothetical protein